MITSKKSTKESKLNKKSNEKPNGNKKETRNIVAHRRKDIPEYNSEYVDELINKAKKTWHDCDSQKWLKEIRGEA